MGVHRGRFSVFVDTMIFQRCGDIMKRRTNIIFIIILLLCCVIGILCCSLWKHKDCFSSDKFVTETAKELETLNTETILESEYEKRITTVHSNFEKSEINYEYAKKWDEFADKYYSELLELASDDLKENLIVSQEAWDNYAEISAETRLGYLQNIYEYGTIVPVIHSQYVYDLHHDRALEIYEMYLTMKNKKCTGDGSVC